VNGEDAKASRRNPATAAAWWCGGLSVAIVAIAWGAWFTFGEDFQSRTSDFYRQVFKPAFHAAYLISGNPHWIDPIVTFGAQVLQCFVVLYLPTWGIAIALRRVRGWNS
jgi:hypothetical protein